MAQVFTSQIRSTRLAFTLCVVLLCVSFIPGVSVAQSLCGDAQPKEVPALIQEQLKGDVEGQANLVTRWLGSGQLKGAVDTSRMELHEKHNDVDQHQIDMYFMWVACEFINSDRNLSGAEKAKAWVQVRSAFPPQSRPPIIQQQRPPTDTRGDDGTVTRQIEAKIVAETTPAVLRAQVFAANLIGIELCQFSPITSIMRCNRAKARQNSAEVGLGTPQVDLPVMLRIRTLGQPVNLSFEFST